jgi:hypothetical protein
MCLSPWVHKKKQPDGLVLLYYFKLNGLKNQFKKNERTTVNPAFNPQEHINNPYLSIYLAVCYVHILGGLVDPTTTIICSSPESY